MWWIALVAAAGIYAGYKLRRGVDDAGKLLPAAGKTLDDVSRAADDKAIKEQIAADEKRRAEQAAAKENVLRDAEKAAADRGVATTRVGNNVIPSEQTESQEDYNRRFAEWVKSQRKN